MIEVQPGKHLLIASAGGHLAELLKWSVTLGSAPNSLWVTFDTPQTASLLEGRRILHVPYVAPRDLRATLRAYQDITRRIDWDAESFSCAVSTGAAVGAAGLLAARKNGLPRVFIESLSRVNGPSTTGRLLRLDRSLDRYCQYEHWSGRGWKYAGTVFDLFETRTKSSVAAPRVFVTLGTIHPYRFDALIDAVLSCGIADDRIVWQTGATSGRLLPGKSFNIMTDSEFKEAAANADVVITHAGAGTVANLLETGIVPVVVPRRSKRREHVDDHQTQIAQLLKHRGIAVVREVEDLDFESIVEASAMVARLSR